MTAHVPSLPFDVSFEQEQCPDVRTEAKLDIAAWLQSLGLEQYAGAFRANDVDTDVLHELTAEDLKELGVASVGHRRRLLAAIAARPGADAPTSAPDKPASSPDAERRHLTVMFVDLVGSTALSSRLDPEEMRDVLRAYQNAVAGEIIRFEGHVAKYMGDGVLAYFGYPQAHEDDVERAVKAGLALIEAVAKLSAPEPLRGRVGIATGLVVVGDLIGSGEAQECGIVGETPNLAARLQALAEPDTIVIAPATQRQLSGLFEYRDLGRVEVKGLPEPVHAYQVIRESAVESRFDALHGVAPTPLVGREEEIDLLLRRWQRAAGGDGQVVLLSGEPGIGKSRLSAVVQERIANEPHTRLRYFCSPHHQDSALHPIIAQLERAAGFAREDTAEAKLDKLAAMLAPDSPPREDEALLAGLLSLPAEGRLAPVQLTPQRKKERTFEALLRHLDALARQRPVLMLFEDAHWIDPSSRELLDHIVERVPRLPLLLIVTFRPEFQSPWTGQAHVTLLALNRLGRREGAALVREVVGAGTLPGDVVEEIAERTDGVPLFAEELTKAILETGRGDARTTLSTTSPAALALPATLHASLMARLDRLGQAAKMVAQVGSAIGREFSYDLLRAVAGPRDRAVDKGIAALTAAQLWFQRGTPPDASFMFKHALVQDAAYGTLLRARRQQLHAAIAQALEQQFPGQAETQPELVAHHLSEACQPERAVGYWLKAGRRSAERSADREAVRQLRRGLETLMNLPASVERDRMELDFQLALGTPLISLHGWSGAPVAAAYERASLLCERLDDAGKLSPALFGLASNRIVRGETRAARQLAGRLRVAAERSGDPVSRLLAHRAVGAATMQLGEFAQARSEFAQIGALYDPQRDRSLAARCVTDPRASGLSFLSLVLWILGYPEQARRTAREASRCATELGHANTIGHTLCHAGAELAQFLRDVPAVRSHADAAIALAAKHHMPMWHGYGTVFRGWAVAQEGRGGDGAWLVRQGIEDLARLGTVFHRSYHLGILAAIHARLGDAETGLRVIEDAHDEVRRTEVCFCEAELHRIEGELRCLAGSPGAEVEACFAAARALACRQEAKAFELRAATSLARLWRDQGKRTEARALLAPVYGWFTEGFDTPDLIDAGALLEMLR